MKTIHDIPGVVEELDRCQARVSELIGSPVAIRYELKVYNLTTSRLLKIIQEECGVSWRNVQEGGRKSDLVIARHLFCYFGWFHAKLTLPVMADIIRRDHTTVIHGRDKVTKMIETSDDLYMPYINAVENRINEIYLPTRNKANADSK